MSIHDLPAVNAMLNATSGVLLVIGYLLMRARKIAQHIKLISIVNAKVRIYMPDKNGIDRTDAALSFREEPVNGVLPRLRIVKAAIPDKQLHLREDALRPLQIRAIILSAVEAKKGAAFAPPCFQSLQPTVLLGG